VHPREQTDTVALDVSAFVVEGEVRIRLSSDSCHVAKYQVLDRLVLSTADSSRATRRAIEIASATLGGEDVLSDLGKADDVRVWTRPGDVISLGFEASGSPDCFVIESRGWYRPLER
jgi:hypothetical protein